MDGVELYKQADEVPSADNARDGSNHKETGVLVSLVSGRFDGVFQHVNEAPYGPCKVPTVVREFHSTFTGKSSAQTGS